MENQYRFQINLVMELTSKFLNEKIKKKEQVNCAEIVSAVNMAIKCSSDNKFKKCFMQISKLVNAGNIQKLSNVAFKLCKIANDKIFNEYVRVFVKVCMGYNVEYGIPVLNEIYKIWKIEHPKNKEDK